jgi:sigma-E factor negative regulatory protein RseC
VIEQQAQVVRVRDKRVFVRVGADSGCSACDQGKGCGAGVFGKLLKKKPVTLAFRNDCNARVGQAVMVGVPEAVFLRLVFRFYGFPLLAGLAGAVLGHQIGLVNGANDGMTDLLTLAGALVAAGLFLWKGWPGDGAGLNRYKVKLLGPADKRSGAQCHGNKIPEN